MPYKLACTFLLIQSTCIEHILYVRQCWGQSARFWLRNLLCCFWIIKNGLLYGKIIMNIMGIFTRVLKMLYTIFLWLLGIKNIHTKNTIKYISYSEVPNESLEVVKSMLVLPSPPPKKNQAKRHREFKKQKDTKQKSLREFNAPMNLFHDLHSPLRISGVNIIFRFMSPSPTYLV